jgi:hypothetical protein
MGNVLSVCFCRSSSMPNASSGITPSKGLRPPGNSKHSNVPSRPSSEILASWKIRALLIPVAVSTSTSRKISNPSCSMTSAGRQRVVAPVSTSTFSSSTERTSGLAMLPRAANPRLVDWWWLRLSQFCPLSLVQLRSWSYLRQHTPSIADSQKRSLSYPFSGSQRRD